MKNSQKKVIKYIEDNKIELKDSNIITIGIQQSCEMAIVDLNGSCLMMGNYWDFHNGCHGMDVPEFNSHIGLAGIFEDALIAYGKKVQVVINKEWKYDEDE